MIASLEHYDLDTSEVKRLVKLALDEDLRYGPDVTTNATIAPNAKSVAEVVARQPGVVAGLPVASISKALKKQIGLDLRQTRKKIDILIVDHAERVPRPD